ncbi:MAG: TlpA family protein disulfide reductase [Actinobacteria bacterium]|nr:TlpA family protein disulfide reductase [Actinomycetota bacterium]MBV8562395.1 TlpA family protein disulfide reductase [Actinomycetota bacterium]
MRLREGARSGLEIVLVDIWEGTDPRPEVERFCDMWGIKGPILLDETGEYARLLGVRGVPTNVVVDSDGIVRAFGAARLDELERAIDDVTGS